MPPIVLSPALPSEILTYILTQQIHPATLIICQPRAAFLSGLLRCVQPGRDAPSLSSEEDANSRTTQEPHRVDPLYRHPLMIPTLHQLAISRNINLVFVPTVSHLRAYMAASPSAEAKLAKEDLDVGFEGTERLNRKKPLLMVYRLVELHRDTSEWSAQGLGNSLAALVEAGLRSRRQVAIVEEKNESGEVDEDSEGLDERVPILSGSARRAGLESDGGGWSGRTVEVGRILSRWFVFKKEYWSKERKPNLQTMTTE